MKTLHKVAGTVVLLLMMALSVGAEGNKPAKAPGAKAPGARATRAKNFAKLRVLHAIPGGPAVDVYVDGEKSLSNVGYKTLSEYLTVPSGKRRVKVTAAGKTEALLEEAVSTTKDKNFVVAVYGTAAKPMLLRQNELTGKDSAEKARLRVYHLVTDAPAVAVTYPTTRGKKGYANLVKELPPGKSSTKLQTPGALTIQVRAGDKLLKELPAVQMEAGKRYAVFLIGTAAALDAVVAP